MGRAYRWAGPGATGGTQRWVRFRRRPCAPGQPSANTAVTVTVTCWLPGEIGTGEEAARPALGAANIGSTGAGCCSDTLTTGPREAPSALAYWAALALASAAALARAAASRELVSFRFSETPSTWVALPPARTAALIWVPAAASVRRVTAMDSLTPYPAGTAELLVYSGWIDRPEVWMSEPRTPFRASARVTAATARLARCSAALTEDPLVCTPMYSIS